MEIKVRTDLKRILTSDVKNYENYSLDEERKSKGLKVISDEIKILHDEENHKVELTGKRKKIKLEELKTHAQVNLDEKKYKLEREKVEEQNQLNVKKHNLDIDKYDHSVIIENAKINLETSKFKHQKEYDNKKHTLEVTKHEHQKLIEDERLKLEVRKVLTEEGKLALDINKFKEDIRMKTSELQQNRVDKVINIGIEVLKIGLPLAIYTRLVMKNFRLIYADDGRVPSEMKDLMKNITSRR